MTRPRRVKYFTASMQSIVQMCTTGGWVRCIRGLPEDAEFKTAFYDDRYEQWRIYVYSDTFNIVPEGEEVQRMDVNFEWEERKHSEEER